MTCQNTKVVKLSDTIIPKYYDLFNDWNIEHKIFTSGCAGTKSSRMAIKAIYTIVSDPDVAMVILRKFHNKLRKTVYKEVIRAINRLNLDKNDFKITASQCGSDEKYGNLVEETGYGDIEGLGGVNCRHRISAATEDMKYKLNNQIFASKKDDIDNIYYSEF